MEFLGWLGAFCFAICGLPQCWQSIKTGNSNGMSWLFLILWFVGELLTLIYTMPKGHLPLTFNYICNLIIVGTILWYKIKPRKPKS